MSTGAVVFVLALPAVTLSYAQQTGQPTFASAEAAHRALFSSVEKHDDHNTMTILGVKEDGIFSGDNDRDKLDREHFAQKYQQMHRLERGPDGAMVLYVGAENWPFPFPLVAKNGAWFFDSDAGMDEILFRRVGDNEMAAIRRMQQLIKADPDAGAAGPSENPIHGYYFRAIDTKTSKSGDAKAGAAFIAYPAEYRSCGVMTFIADQKGVVYEKDLGANTAERATAIKKFTAGRGWRPAE